ncbi:uncharacterized protein LOC105722203 isoform X3 [Aotus nancymaae]|uniref:uncharacterized protein LOC105722203 isoform X3 n=1 Tax=Aotus nancymaae TaxID=37293 RepID=UPI0030FE6A23
MGSHCSQVGSTTLDPSMPALQGPLQGLGAQRPLERLCPDLRSRLVRICLGQLAPGEAASLGRTVSCLACPPFLSQAQSAAPSAQMNPSSNKRKLSRVIFDPSTSQVSWKSSLAGLRQSEREAYVFIVKFLEEEHMSEFTKLKFLRAVETLSSAVHAQADGNMDDSYPKTILAKKIEILILEESTENVMGSVHQQAMLCIVALSRVNPPFHLSQKLDLVNVGVSSMFSLPLIVPGLCRRDNASLYLQMVQALDDMLQALVMDDMRPNVLILQNFLESGMWNQEKEGSGTPTEGVTNSLCSFSGSPYLGHYCQTKCTNRRGPWALFPGC